VLNTLVLILLQIFSWFPWTGSWSGVHGGVPPLERRRNPLRILISLMMWLYLLTWCIRSRTGQPLLSDTVCSRRLSFFGHLHRADPWQDHQRALQPCIMDPPGDWRRRAGRPRQSWLRTVEADLRPMNLGLATAKRRAQDRSAWRLLVATATSSTSS